MSQTTVLVLKAIESFGDVVFWLMMIPAILKYHIFSRLPGWLLFPMLLGAAMSGVAGITLHLIS